MVQLAARVDVVIDYSIPYETSARTNRLMGLEYTDIKKDMTMDYVKKSNYTKNNPGIYYLKDASGEPLLDENNNQRYLTWWYDNSNSDIGNVLQNRNKVKYIYSDINNKIVTLEKNINAKAFFISGEVLESSWDTTRWTLDIPEVTLYNVETRSYIMENDIMKDQSKKTWDETSLIDGYSFKPEKLNDSTFVFSFYTYEKPEYVNDLTEVLRVEFDVNWDKQKFVYRERYEVNTAGVWIKKNLASVLSNGWAEDGTFTMVYPDISSIDPEDFLGMHNTNSSVLEEAITQKRYAFIVNPHADGQKNYTNGLVRGNIYSTSFRFYEAPVITPMTKASLRSSTDQAEASWLDMEWMVAPW
ncbi:hypothetical protein M2137_002135 [Parabacteroides sp. PFB2-10]|uniref:hypothetical protein n=1 Tax=Parabacteroides sp. PFB2-10 TaxID=1742405 RepID=UPI0024763751|nr:hypothetical protein [Parabacteroides sp. PFB2-10]MDH6313345.1 hypothetical protein [Parabacteroides sp. PFB2-10]